MQDWIEWNSGKRPVSEHTRVSVRWRSGEIMTNHAIKFAWVHSGFADDVVAYKILDEEPKGHKNAEILIEIAKEAAVNAEYWKEFEFESVSGWHILDNQTHLFNNLLHDFPFRRKPRTIRIGDIDVPEPMRGLVEEGQSFYYPLITNIGGALAANEYWVGGDRDMGKLERGLVHLDKESAILHAKALLSLTQKKE